MPYSYDRRAASLKPETAINYDAATGRVNLSVLSGTLLGVWYRFLTDDPEDDVEMMWAEIHGLEKQIKELSASDQSDLDNKVDYLIGRAPGPWDYSNNFSDRDKGLEKLQWERKKVVDKQKRKAFRKWLREGVVDLVAGVYKKYKAGYFSKEPCVTASYIKDLLNNIPGWTDHQQTFRDMDNRKQLAACHYALESARKAGKLTSSLGTAFGRGKRETRCYEPASW